MRVRFTILFALLFAGWLWLDARAQTGGPIVSGAHRFEKVTDGVYYATASGTMTVGSNSPIIVTDTEAIIIDSEITPAAARALVADIKAITDKPVRYVIDSYYHYDHAHGNQIFAPDVQVIGHENTRRRMLTNVLEQYTCLTSVEPVPARVAALKQRISQETDPQQKAALERQVVNSLSYLEQVKETKVTPPNVTLMQGHGVVFTGKAKIDAFQRYLRDVIKQTADLKKAGLSANDAAQEIDVTAHKNDFPQIRGVGIDPAGVRRIYTLAEHPE